jgi:hypothetical protein
MAFVVSLTESGLDVTHCSCQRHWSSPQSEVVVIGHHAPGQDYQTVSASGLPNDFQKLNRFLGFRKQVGATREAIVNVVDTALDEYSRPSRHCASSAILPNR